MELERERDRERGVISAVKERTQSPGFEHQLIWPICMADKSPCKVPIYPSPIMQDEPSSDVSHSCRSDSAENTSHRSSPLFTQKGPRTTGCSWMTRSVLWIWSNAAGVSQRSKQQRRRHEPKGGRKRWACRHRWGESDAGGPIRGSTSYLAMPSPACRQKCRRDKLKGERKKTWCQFSICTIKDQIP
jgi:hypothetical protein